MAQENHTVTAEGFVGAVFKYSVSTFVNIGIYGVSMLLTGLFIPEDVLSPVNLFNTWTATLMNVAILGLDQSLIRFYNEPPQGLSKNGLFRLCFGFSSAVLAAGGGVAGVFLAAPLYGALGFTAPVGGWVVPLLFLNAFFYMVARYFNVLYRMEGNIRLYTVESVLMQFFCKLFFVLGALGGFENPAAAMILCAAGGLGAFALAFAFLRRGALRPRRGGGALAGGRTVLPYAVAVAPTAIMLTLNTSVTQSYLSHQLGSAGTYGFAYSLSNIVTMAQGGFASFWGPYMFQHYRTDQARIKRVHAYLNLIILLFFAALVALEDALFFILREYRGAQPIFPLMMLGAVFTILCETTVYGNAIARRPLFDTVGHALNLAVNLAGLPVLVPRFGLAGAAAALALANGVMFAFRTWTAQRLYSSIDAPGKTAAAIGAAVALAAAGSLWAHHFWLKFAASAVVGAAVCLLYRRELVRCARLGLALLSSLFRRGGKRPG